MALSCGAAMGAFQKVALTMGAFMLGLSSVPANAAPVSTVPVASQAQKVIPATDAKTEAAIQKFIAQFPPQFHDVLAEYRTTKIGAALLVEVAVLDPIVLVDEKETGSWMYNAVHQGRPVIVLTKIMQKNMDLPQDRVRFMLSFANEVSTASLPEARISYSHYLLEKDLFLKFLEHSIWTEVASDALESEMLKELCNKGYYSLDVINSAIQDRPLSSGANTSVDLKRDYVGEESRIAFLKQRWDANQQSRRIQGYINDGINQILYIVADRDQVRLATGFNPKAAVQFAADPAVHYNAMAGDPKFMEVMAPVVLQLRSMMVKALADRGIPTQGPLPGSLAKPAQRR